MKHLHHLRRIEHHPPLGEQQAMGRNLDGLESPADKLARFLHEAGTAELAHAAHEEAVGVTPDHFLEVVVLNSVDKLLGDYSRRDLGVVHVGEEHLGRVAPVNHKRRKHLAHLAQELRAAAVVRQRADGQTVDHRVLLQPQMGVRVYYLKVHKSFSFIARYELAQPTRFWSPMMSCTSFTSSQSMGSSTYSMFFFTLSGLAELKSVVAMRGLLTEYWMASFSMG